MLKHYDICGREIRLGDYATYIVCSGYSHFQVRVCRVVKLTEYTVQAVAVEPKNYKEFGTMNVRISCNVMNNGNRVTISHTERMTVVDAEHMNSSICHVLDALYTKELSKQ